MQKSAKYALIAVVLVILLGGFGFYWFFLRSDAPPRASLQIGTPSSTLADAPSTADGTWTVQRGDAVFVGYRVQELFGGETVKATAVGRTPAVDGTLTVAGDQITTADVRADVSQLSSDKSQRDQQIKTRGLETDTFPDAEFVLTQPIALGSAPSQGQEVDVTATGDLTLHGQTRSVEIPLKARWDGGTITVAGGAEVSFADYGIERAEQRPGVGGRHR